MPVILTVVTGAGAGAGAAAFGRATPLSQANFLPDLTQVNFFVAVELVVPAFAHAAPADGAAAKEALGTKKEVAVRRRG